MLDEETLLKGLWRLFMPEIASGEAVRFCFSKDLLAEHFEKDGHSAEDVLDAVFRVASMCFVVSGNKAWLVPDALVEGYASLSKTIVLVCQQVLAVEEMIKEGTQYSENAYFPRLRALMHAELPRWSANPFSFDDFESIWRTFAREVWHVKGSSSKTITFEFGAHEGANKARQFPLSQALFSRADLFELAVRCRLRKLRSTAANEIWDEIRRERSHLCRRAQRLINSGFLRERLIEQARGFAENYSDQSDDPVSPTNLEARKLALFVSLDVIDGFSEEYFAFLASEETGNRVLESPAIGGRLGEVLARRGYAYFALNVLRDCWTYYEGEIEVRAGEPILLIARQNEIYRGKAALSDLEPSAFWDSARMRSLGTDATLWVLPLSLPSSLRSAIRIRGGVPVAETNGAARRLLLFAWEGGICVDTRSHKYLFPYLPTRVRFGSCTYSAEDVLVISGQRMEWASLVSTLSRLQTDVQYDLVYPNGGTANMAVTFARSVTREQMGFLFDPTGRPSPTLECLGSEDLAIVGFSCPNQRIDRPADIGTVAKLLHVLKSNIGRSLTEKERQIAHSKVATSNASAAVKRIIEALLRKNPTAPDELIRELLK